MFEFWPPTRTGPLTIWVLSTRESESSNGDSREPDHNHGGWDRTSIGPVGNREFRPGRRDVPNALQERPYDKTPSDLALGVWCQPDCRAGSLPDEKLPDPNGSHGDSRR